MADDPQQQRKRKRLLVASIGVATVSFLSLQTGCEDAEPVTSGNLLPVPVGSVKDPALAGDAATDAAMDALVTSGNLVAPPVVQPKDAAADALIVSGNLVAPPARDAAAEAADGATDAATDGAAKDAAQSDAKIVIPPSGNLMPVPPLGPR